MDVHFDGSNGLSNSHDVFDDRAQHTISCKDRPITSKLNEGIVEIVIRSHKIVCIA